MSTETTQSPLLQKRNRLLGDWKAGIWLAAINILLIVGFFATMWMSILANRILLETQGWMLPVVPMVLLIYTFLSPVCWFLSGRWLPFCDERRFASACIGTVPILLGMVLAMMLGVVSIAVGAANPASVLVPIVAIVIGAIASCVCVTLVLIGRRPNEFGQEAG